VRVREVLRRFEEGGSEAADPLRDGAADVLVRIVVLERGLHRDTDLDETEAVVGWIDAILEPEAG